MNQDSNYVGSPPSHHASSTAEARSAPSPGNTSTPGAPAGAAAGDEAVKPSRLSLPPIRRDLSFEERCEQAMSLAQEAFSQTGSWVVFYREVLGSQGVVRKLFATSEEMRAFEETAQFGNLLEMAAALRSQDTGKGDEFEPQKMITVRLPKSQHETLKVEAGEHHTSINKLCISKLLLPIESRFVPLEKGKVRGRKPGPQGSRNQRLQEPEASE